MFRTAAALGLILLFATTAAAQENPFGTCRATDVIFANGRVGEPIEGRPNAFRMTLTGAVHIPCGDTELWADRVVYETDTRLLRADGRVLFQQGALQIFAEQAEINTATRLGVFHHATGLSELGSEPAEKSLFGTHEPHVFFEGERIEKAGADEYLITNGRFTTCVQATPRWEMSGSKGTIRLNRYALLRNVQLRVKGVPLLYLPAIYYPINKEGRATGFLLPSYGSSSVLGSSLSNAFFWAIARSQDATLFHDMYFGNGQGYGGEYRYAAAPGSGGRVNVHLLNASGLAQRWFRVDGHANQELPRGFRALGEANFFSDVAAQQVHQNVDVFSRRERFFKGTLTGSLGRYRIFATSEQRDFFHGSATATRTGRAPYGSVTLRESPVGRTSMYFGAWAEGGRVVREDNIDDPSTDRTLWRFDAAPSVRVPLSRLPFLSATASASWRMTHWFESRDPITGEQRAVGLTRQLLETRANVVGPVVSRVFQTPGSGYAERLKHLIEPSFTVQWMSPFDRFNQVVRNEQHIDAIVGGTMTATYGVANRLLARMTGGGAIREILSVNVGQSYYTNALAAAFDSQYQTGGVLPPTRTGTFSPIRIEATTRPVDRAAAEFRMEIDSSLYAIRTMSASAHLYATHVQLNAGWSRRSLIPGLPGFDRADLATHYLNTGTTVRTRDNRAGGSYHMNYDVRRLALLQQRVVAYYNSQCCGIAFDWQSAGLPLLGIPADRRWGVSFTLAGIGSFSNPLGSFGGR